MQPERYSRRDCERAKAHVAHVRATGGNMSFDEALKAIGAKELPAPAATKYSRTETPQEARARDDSAFAKDLARKWRQEGRQGVTYAAALAAAKRARRAVDEDMAAKYRRRSSSSSQDLERMVASAMRRMEVTAEHYRRFPPTKQQLTQRIAKAIAGALAEAMRPQTRRWTPAA